LRGLTASRKHCSNRRLAIQGIGRRLAAQLCGPYLPLPVLLLLAAGAIALRFDPSPHLTPDDLGYFSYLPALFGGHPFSLDTLLYPNESPLTHNTVNLWGVGTALGWLPFYSAARLLFPRASLLGPEMWWACGLGTVCYGLGGLTLLYLSLARRFSYWCAGAAALASLVCTPLLYYLSPDPFFSHAFTFFLIAALVWLYTTRDLSRGRIWLAGGLLLGLGADTRPQMVAFVLLPMLLRRPSLRQSALLAGGFLVAFLPQMIYWKATFGQWLVNPQASIYHGFFRAPAVWQVLFSPLHGLFWWHPLLLLAMGGLIWTLRERTLRRIGLACLAAFAVQVVINASAIDWWAGSAFGARRFCDTLPLLAFGLCYAFSRIKPLILCGGLAGWWNICLLLAVWPPEGQPRLLGGAEPLTLSVAKAVLARAFFGI